MFCELQKMPIYHRPATSCLFSQRNGGYLPIWLPFSSFPGRILGPLLLNLNLSSLTIFRFAKFEGIFLTASALAPEAREGLGPCLHGAIRSHLHESPLFSTTSLFCSLGVLPRAQKGLFLRSWNSPEYSAIPGHPVHS